MMIKKADVILLIILLVLGGIVSISSLNTKVEGTTVKITVDGTLYGTYPLDTNKEIEITLDDNVNNITIKDGFVQMTSSNCKNQVCVNQGKIHLVGDKIVCLPHKILIEIEGGGTLDVIS